MCCVHRLYADYWFKWYHGCDFCKCIHACMIIMIIVVVMIMTLARVDSPSSQSAFRIHAGLTPLLASGWRRRSGACFCCLAAVCAVQQHHPPAPPLIHHDDGEGYTDGAAVEKQENALRHTEPCSARVPGRWWLFSPMGCGGSRADAIIEPRYHESWTRETESTWLTNTDVETSLPVANSKSALTSFTIQDSSLHLSHLFTNEAILRLGLIH